MHDRPAHFSTPAAPAAAGSASAITSNAASSIAALTNHASNALGGGYTPRSSRAWKNAGYRHAAAAFGGPAELMNHLAPAGPVYQAGTLSGNPVAVAAGLATLRLADDEVHDYTGAQAAQTWRFPPFFHALLDRGVYPPPSAFEAWFVSTALDDEAWSIIDEALPHAAKAAATAASPTDMAQ